MRLSNAMKAIDGIFDVTVPFSGRATTKGGELVRAYERLVYRWMNDGDMLNIDYGMETCNAAGRFLARYGGAWVSRLVNEAFDTWYDKAEYEDFLSELGDALYELFEQCPGLFGDTTHPDMWDFAKPEDSCWDEEDDYWDEEDDEEVLDW